MTRRDRQRRRRKHEHPVRRAILVGVALLTGSVLAALAGFAGWVVTTANSAPNLSGLTPRIPGQTTEIFAANKKSLGYVSSDVLRSYLTEAKQPQLLRDATVAIEDRRFYQHGGVDYEGLLRAAVKDLFEGGGIQGGSTLTMQLATNVYLPSSIREEHNLKYKIVQAKVANELEAKYSKNQILTRYLNDVPYGTTYGQSAIGVAAASQMFFDKPVAKLDLAQYALLAGLPQAPSEYNPFTSRKLALWRRGEVLEAMVRAGYITQAKANLTQGQSLQVKPNTVYDTVKQPYVVQYAEQQLVSDLGQRTVDKGGLKVYTTINLADQADAQAALEANEGKPGDPAASVVATDPSTGQIVALANSTTYGSGAGETEFNYATQSQRQTGSSFKAFDLMTLIHDDDGDPNDTYYESKPLEAGWLPGYPTYTVKDAEDSYQGTMSITRATALSDNTVFAQLGVDLGMSNVDNMANAMGITQKLFGYPSEAIGGLRYGVSPLQMSNAYATIADGGENIPPQIISKVELPSGNYWYPPDNDKTRVFTSGEAYAGTQTLETVLQYGTGTDAYYGCPAAGKTGTTSNYTDAWFVGYTPKLSTAVWVGYPNSDVYMTDVNGLGPGYGATLAAPIWKQFMQAASDGYCGDFTQPSEYWHGVEYFGKHAVSAYVPPPAVTTTTTSATTGATGGGAAGLGTGDGSQTGSGAGTPPSASNPVNHRVSAAGGGQHGF
jgi:penicillin-binding protein 1A